MIDSIRGVVAIGVCFVVMAASRAAEPNEHPARPQVLVHYMPWFVAKPAAPVWGWHWTMNAFDPDQIERGERSIASHYHPVIGPYDSGDPAVVEYHLLLMKTSGFDGLVVDWYGLSNHLDYPILHRNTASLFAAAARIGLKIAICYEDQTIPKLVEVGEVAEGDRVKHARGVLDWLRKNWFAEPSYLSVEGRPVLLSFGSAGLTDREWEEALPRGADAPIYLSEHRRRPAAAGAFDWPTPKDGLASLDRFARASKDWPFRMSAAFPRFHDIYAEAKVHESYGTIPDDQGRTFTTTLKRALTDGSPFVQVVTWNDWGEGTAIEPSAEFGYRDLEAMQRLRREHVDPAFASVPDDLRLVHRLYLLRRKGHTRPGLAKKLDEVARLIADGRYSAAREALDRAEADVG
ncbi:MAG: glycoside hydrolase family 71/99-like protein [Paludisphaera borealis]|uniref:glycoside hydrolase family 71/99-like protein n=1 Tax=Paludisphaera borealis TaxID=1387353 RepID=UPI00284108F7|nr:glycoside hydrolase family 71/99-like protein [Paludisphaera borealis]MDR3622388.1 glycoside hydrolase family 71/99-like protein [Paludisphaera borealis]